MGRKTRGEKSKKIARNVKCIEFLSCFFHVLNEAVFVFFVLLHLLFCFVFVLGVLFLFVCF